MLETLLTVLPLILVLIIGYALKQAKFLTSQDGSVLLKLVFYAGAPALEFIAIMKVQLDPSLILLCLVAPSVMAATLAVLYLLRKSILAKLSLKTFGTVLVGTMIMNTGFLLPFVQALYGVEGLIRLAIIDAVNGLLAFSLVYGLAVHFGNDRPDLRFVANKLLVSPPFWALIIAVILRLSGVTLPSIGMDALQILAQCVSGVILIALGLKFSFKISRPKLLPVPIVLRYGLGALVGLALVQVFALEGLTAQVAVFAAMAPIGFNSITFSEMEHLDTDFATSQVSASLLIAITSVSFVAGWLPTVG